MKPGGYLQAARPKNSKRGRGTFWNSNLICCGNWLIPAVPWKLIGWVWVYNLVWMAFLDVIKLGIYRFLDKHIRSRAVFSPHSEPYLEHTNRRLQES